MGTHTDMKLKVLAFIRCRKKLNFSHHHLIYGVTLKSSPEELNKNIKKKEHVITIDPAI